MIVAMLMLLLPPAYAQCDTLQMQDRAKQDKGWWREHSDYSTEFRASQLIAPGSLLLIGSLGIGENAPLRRVNLGVREGMLKLSGGEKLRFDDYLQYVPVASHLIMCATPLKTRHTPAERIAATAVSYLAMVVMTNTLKYTICEVRPNGGENNSFPSGHTATAFVGAELMRTEYGWGIGAVGYAVATGVAFMRLYNNRHWLNDVIGGAAIGILSARIGYWLLPLSRKIFKLKPQTAMVATPTYIPEQHAIGFACSMSF